MTTSNGNVRELRYRQEVGPGEWNLRESALLSFTVVLPEALRRPKVAVGLVVSTVVYALIALVDSTFGLIGLGLTAVIVVAIPAAGILVSRRWAMTGGFQELVYRQTGFSYVGPYSERLPPEIPYTDVTVLGKYKRATVMRSRHLSGAAMIAEPELMPQEAYDRVRAGMRR